MSYQAKLIALLVLTVAAFVLAVVAPPYGQPLDYHNFADRRVFLSVPNFSDVISNIPFLLAGIWGIRVVAGTRHAASFATPRESPAYAMFFVGMLLTGLGSTYYHLAPSSPRLAWDRAAMMVALSSLLAATIADRIDARLGRVLLAPLLLLGVGTVIYWRWSAASSEENVIPYFGFEGYAIGTVMLAILFCRSRYTHGSDALTAMALYGLAVAAEQLDKTIYNLGEIVSGHTLKHLLAASAAFVFLRMLRRRVLMI